METNKAILEMKSACELLDAGLKNDCQAYIDGKIKTQSEIARKHRVTRACISRRVKAMRPVNLEAVTRLVKSWIQQENKTNALRQLIVAQTKKPMTPQKCLPWRFCHD